MRFFRRFFPWVLFILMAFILMACSTQSAEDIDELGVTEANIIREAPTTADYSGVNLILNSYQRTEESDGAAAGTILLNVTFENTTNSIVSLPFGDDSYTILDSAGLSIVPSELANSLRLPEIDANSSITGTIEYAVTQAEDTFTLQIGEYDDIPFSTVVPE